MKKLLVLFSLISIFNSFAQEPEKPTQTITTTTVVTTNPILVEEKKALPILKKNEIRIDPFYLIFAGALNVNYERILNEESGFGATLLLSSGKDINKIFSLSPYYRIYFGKKTAAGFFFESFAEYSSKRVYEFNFFNDNKTNPETINDLALGIGLGGKWISRKGIIFELSAGIGRNLLNEYNIFDGTSEVTGKGGISIGKRF